MGNISSLLPKKKMNKFIANLEINRLKNKMNNHKENLNNDTSNLNTFLGTENMDYVEENIIKEYEGLWN